MSSFKKVLSFCVCVVLAQTQFVNSQHPVPSISEQLQRLQQTQQAQKETEQSDVGKKQTTESVPMSQFNYRTPVNNGYGAYQGYPRDVYASVLSQTSPGIPQPKGNLFNLASGGDYFLTAQFSQIFYSFVGVVVLIALLVFVVKYLYAFDVSGIVQKIKDGSSPTGKSMDLNHLTNMVYRAIDTYDASTAKDDE